MPGPAAAAAFFTPGAMAAAKRMAWEASTYLATPEAAHLTSAAFVAIWARWLWKRLPSWIREDISFRALVRSKDGTSGTDDCSDSDQRRAELSHLASVLDSLNRVAQYVEQLHDIPQIHATVLAYIQWSGQMKQEQLFQQTLDKRCTRDFMYTSAGKEIDLRNDPQFKEIQEALQLATLAYHHDSQRLRERLVEHDLDLLRHEIASDRPGNVAYYVARSASKRTLFVGIRGTSSLEDIVTDCCGHATPLQNWGKAEEGMERGRVEVEASRPHLIIEQEDVGEKDTHFGAVEVISGHERIRVENDDIDGDNYIRCHEGILISARRMVQKITPVIEKWISEEEHQLVLCGHSLGGGAASLAAVLLRLQYPEMENRIRAIAIAPPPVLDHDSAIAASTYITSIVHNADLVPRCSLYNLALLLEGFRFLHERLKASHMNPTGPRTTAKFFKQLSKGIDGDILMTIEEWNSAIENGAPRIRQPDHLFVPGRVLLVYHPWSHDADVNEEGRDQKMNLEGRIGIARTCIETNGATPILRKIEADGPRLFTDHVCSSYFEALDTDYCF